MSVQEPPVTRETVLDTDLGEAHPTRRVQVRRIRMTADTAGGLHVHNGPVFGSIVEGSAWFQVEGGAEVELMPGDVFYEPQGGRIARFDAGSHGVTFLGYFLLSEDQEPEIAFPGTDSAGQA